MLGHSVKVAVAFIVIVLGLTLGAATVAAQDGSAARTVALENFGWEPGFEGGSGSITYEGLNDPFQATVNVDDLLPNHEYGVTVMGVGIDGTTTSDDSSFTIMTDGNGAGSTEVSLELPTGEGVPAYQVHFLIVDTSQPLEEPLPNPLGVPFAVPLACQFPLGFRVAEAGSALPVVDDSTIALVNLGFAPGFEGGGGSFTWSGRGDSFEADVTATDLLPDHDYVLYVMAAGLDGSITLDSTSYPVTTDAAGTASSHVSLSPSAEEAPIPAFQVHILVVDETVTLEEPLPNPLGIPHPIALACEFPAGFLGLPEAGPPEEDVAPPETGTGGKLDTRQGGTPLWMAMLLLGVGLTVLAGGLGSVMRRRRGSVS